MPLKKELDFLEDRINELEKRLGSWRSRDPDPDERLDQEAQLVFMKEYRKILRNRLKRLGKVCN